MFDEDYEMGLRGIEEVIRMFDEEDELYEMGLREIARQEREIVEHDTHIMILINKMSNIKSSLCMIQRII